MINITKRNLGGKPLVFFHGWGFDSSIWDTVVLDLQGYEIILVDLPGFGATDLMDWVTFKQQLLCQLPAVFMLIGWSLGGLFATRLALEEPERVMKLLNVTSSPHFIAQEKWPGITPLVFNNFYQHLSVNSKATITEFIALQMGSKKLPSQYIPSSNVEGLKPGLDILKSWDFREDLDGVKMPVCYVFGRLDPIVSPKTMQQMAVRYPQFDYVLFKKSAHMPFVSEPEVFLELIKSWA